MKYITNITFTSVIIFVIYLFLVSPRILGRPDMSGLKGKIIAHRGWHDNKAVPENSAAAFGLAVVHGYGAELDVQLTKAKIPVEFHDYDLRRMCGVDIKIADITFDELSKYKLLDTEETIPKLEDVLRIINGCVPLIVELKGEKLKSDLCRYTIPLLQAYKGEYYVESFNMFLLREFAKSMRHIPRGILSTRFGKLGEHGGIFGALHQRLTLNFLCRPDFIAYDCRYYNFYPIKVCRKMGCACVAWTVRTNEEYENTKDAFSALICENIDDIKLSSVL